MASTGLTNNRPALVYTVGAQVHGSRIEVIPGDYYGNNVHLSNRCSLKTRGNGDNSSVFVLSLSTACARRLFFSLSTSVWPFYFYFPPYLPSLFGISSVSLTVFTPFPSQLPSVIHLLALALSLCLFPSFPLFIAVGANVTFMCCQLAAWPSIIICSH